jgi:SAM-dependent methyltransferase
VPSLDELIPLLRCPRSRRPLVRNDAALASDDGTHAYAIEDGVPDLRVSPARLVLDLPWREPWDALDRLPLDPPPPLHAPDLPHHLDAHLAGVAGARGDGRRILEVGCGERLCERWFAERGFAYVGTDFDRRGMGPHFLSDAHNLPLPDASFDLTFSLAVYEHLVVPLVAAREAFRVLRPGGTFFGSAAFVYCFHDRASFHHMSHAGLLWTLENAGFTVERIWPDWLYPSAIAEMGFRGTQGAPWRVATRAALRTLEASFVATSNVARRLAGKERLDVARRNVETAGSLSFVAHKPAL